MRKTLDPSLKSNLDFTKATDQVSCKTATLTVIHSVQELVRVRDTGGGGSLFMVVEVGRMEKAGLKPCKTLY